MRFCIIDLKEGVGEVKVAKYHCETCISSYLWTRGWQVNWFHSSQIAFNLFPNTTRMWIPTVSGVISVPNDLSFHFSIYSQAIFTSQQINILKIAFDFTKHIAGTSQCSFHLFFTVIIELITRWIADCAFMKCCYSGTIFKLPDINVMSYKQCGSALITP